MALPNTRGDREQQKFVEDQDGNTSQRVIDTHKDAGLQRQYLSRLLDTDGDGTGTLNFTGNYSAGEIAFIAPGAGEIFRIARLIVHITDTGAINDGSKYGGITISSGLDLQLTDVFGTETLTDINITTTLDWGKYCYDVSMSDFATGGNHFQARWTFKRGGQFLRLVGDDSHKLEIHLGDDFSGLDAHTFTVQGYKE